MKMLDDAGAALDADDCLALVSPRLVWRVSLPGTYQQPATGKAVQPVQIIRRWLKSLRRRSQNHRMDWARMDRLADQWLPLPRILHPWPEQRFAAITQGRSPVR
jgi:hypothetical protein